MFPFSSHPGVSFIMSQERRFFLLLIGLAMGLVAFSLAYPLMATVLYGFQPNAWPASVIRPGIWFNHVFSLNINFVLSPYIYLLFQTSDAFRGQEGWVLGSATVLFGLLFGPIIAVMELGGIKRDPDGVHGDSRWATKGERKKMSAGLEFGVDAETDKPIRVAFEGNLTSLAPPREGKGSGLVIPNLLVADDQAWMGSVVLVDPKGEAFRAVADRRRKLGRCVLAIDPFGLVAGADRFNPLKGVDPDDVVRLQRMASAMLPASTGDDKNRYFRDGAVELIAGAMHAVLRAGRSNLSDVARLVRDPERLEQTLAGNTEQVAEAALVICRLKPEARGSIISTASQAFSWMTDRRGAAIVDSGTFTLQEITEGKVDLFITLPTENIELLAPFLRLLFSELFATVRQSPPAHRILVMIDEAATLGRFKELEQAWGELPGYGVSLWTFFQDRGQIISHYGRDVAGMFLRTSEFVTISDLAQVDPDELEYWSRALSDYTVIDESKSETTGGGADGSKTTIATRSQKVRLMTPDRLAHMSPDEMLLFPRSKRYTRYPMKLRKTRYFEDARFKGKFVGRRPVGPS